MTAPVAPCYTSRFTGKPVPIIGYVIAQWGGRLRIVAVDYRSKWKRHGWPDCNPAANKIAVDKDRVIREFSTEAAARRALDAGNAHWMIDRSLAYDAIHREPEA